MQRNDWREPVPVTLITGFLGSGKTTLLNRLLRVPSLADTAVIVNEFGEIGLDHLLIEQAIENAVLLKNGCICCSVRGDIADTLSELWRKRAAGEIPWFRRIAIETTGLADPAPVAHTLVEVSDGPCACRLDGIVTTVDALHGAAQLHRQTEACNQVAFADRILLTKTDLATPEQIASTIDAIRRINSAVPLRDVIEGDAAEQDVFGLCPDSNDPDPRVRRWLGDHDAHHDHEHDDHDHHDGIAALVVRAEHPIPRAALMLWLNSLLSLRGADVLRLKGVVSLADEPYPVVLQAVHHVLHPPVPLPHTSEPGKSRIVVIHRRLSPVGLLESFAVALAAGPQ